MSRLEEIKESNEDRFYRLTPAPPFALDIRWLITHCEELSSRCSELEREIKILKDPSDARCRGARKRDHTL